MNLSVPAVPALAELLNCLPLPSYLFRDRRVPAGLPTRHFIARLGRYATEKTPAKTLFTGTPPRRRRRTRKFNFDRHKNFRPQSFGCIWMDSDWKLPTARINLSFGSGKRKPFLAGTGTRDWDWRFILNWRNLEEAISKWCETVSCHGVRIRVDFIWSFYVNQFWYSRLKCGIRELQSDSVGELICCGHESSKSPKWCRRNVLCSMRPSSC